MKTTNKDFDKILETKTTIEELYELIECNAHILTTAQYFIVQGKIDKLAKEM